MSDWSGSAASDDDLELSAISSIRLELGKDKSEDYLTDDEIAYIYATQGNYNVLLTAAYCCDKIVGLLSDTGYVDQSMAGSSASLSQMVEWWRQKAIDLRDRAMNPSITPRFSSSPSRRLKFGIGQMDAWPGVTDGRLL